MPTVLITGGSMGIGLELSKLFAADDYRLLIVSKYEQEILDAEQLFQQIHPENEVHFLVADLSEPGAAQKVYDWTKSLGYELDVLVNNAGFGTWGNVTDLPLEKETAMIRLNAMCVYELTRLFLRDMQNRNAGRIMNIASIAAFQPTPYMATYGATKAFVHNFTRALAEELKDQGSGVQVISVCPTQAHSGFQKAAGMEKSRLFNTVFAIDAKTVAQYAYKGMNDGKFFVIPKRRFAWLHKVIRRLPSSWVLWYAKYSTGKLENK